MIGKLIKSNNNETIFNLVWQANEVFTEPQIRTLGSDVYVLSSTVPFPFTTTNLPQEHELGQWKLISSFPFVIQTTHADLLNLATNSQLIAGQQYQITDYTATVGTQIDYAISAGNVFDIIVTADSENKLNETARAIRHAGDTYFPPQTKFESWELKYTIYNNENIHNWADEVNGKGVIYFMKDEFCNEIPYDFKNIKFKRYKVIAVSNIDLEAQFLGRYYGQQDNLLTLDMMDSTYLYTFHNELLDKDFSISYEGEYGKSFGFNIIKENTYSTIVDDIRYTNLVLNNIVFISEESSLVKKNVFGFDCENNTFGTGITGNTFGNDIVNNTFGNYIVNNTFGNDIVNNTFGYYIVNNTFGNDIDTNTFGNYITGNTFGNYITGNTFGTGITGNTFGTGITGITGNTFGNYISGNTFGNYISGNTFGNDIVNNTFGNNIRYVNFGSNKGEYLGVDLIIKSGVQGVSDILMLDIDDGISLFENEPRQVTVMQSSTKGTFIIESRESASLTYAYDFTA